MSRQFNVGGSPHVGPERTVAQVMRQVLYALIPGVVAYVFFFGVGILIQIALAICFALTLEAICLYLRGQPLKLYLGDYSVVVTAVLFALCIPPIAPFWVSLTGMVAAVVIAKHLYGGLGHNVFNPAMVGYVVVLISFPQAMTAWPSPAGIEGGQLSISRTLEIIFLSSWPISSGWDAVSQATPLDLIKTGMEQGRMVSEVRTGPVFGDFGGQGWEWLANFYALGGFWLLYKRVISWHVPVAVLGTVILVTLPAFLIDPGSNPNSFQHIFSGGLMLGAFFIATDPVTGCASPRGRLIFGLGVAIITLAIRRWGAYPDGVAFAVLSMNMLAPLIDRYTRPRVYGEGLS